MDVATTVTNSIKSTLQDWIVYPTHLVIPLTEDGALDAMELTRPPPVGILRFTVMEGKDLPRMDRKTGFGISGMTSSDPYVRCQLKDHSEFVQTETLKKTVNPVWKAETSTFEVRWS